MKNILKYEFAILLTFSFLFLFNSAQSQDKTRIFTNIDFNKVSPQKVNDYLNLEEKMWKPIQAEHIKQGGLSAWNVFRVWFNGTGSEYNYAVMELYKNYEDMSFVYSDNIITKVHPGINETKLMNDTYNARDIVRAQSAVRINMLRPEEIKQPYKYVLVTYIDTRRLSELLLEKNIHEITLPALKEEMNSGLNQGWDLFKILIPNGSSSPFQYISFEYLNNMGELTKTGSTVNLKGISPGEVYKTELWERVEYLGGE